MLPGPAPRKFALDRGLKMATEHGGQHSALAAGDGGGRELQVGQGGLQPTPAWRPHVLHPCPALALLHPCPGCTPACTPQVLGLANAYHGSTLGAMDCTHAPH